MCQPGHHSPAYPSVRPSLCVNAIYASLSVSSCQWKAAVAGSFESSGALLLSSISRTNSQGACTGPWSTSVSVFELETLFSRDRACKQSDPTELNRLNCARKIGIKQTHRQHESTRYPSHTLRCYGWRFGVVVTRWPRST